MLSSSKELKNIPVSISILHEQEYDNLCLILKLLKGKAGKRRAFSERSNEKVSEELNTPKTFSSRCCEALKN
jgi:hypothetical protein